MEIFEGEAGDTDFKLLIKMLSLIPKQVHNSHSAIISVSLPTSYSGRPNG